MVSNANSANDRPDERMLDALSCFRSGDYSGALFKLKRLEQEGYPYASLYLANLYEKGYPGVPRDLNKAVQIYELLAEHNDPAAIGALARLHFTGTEVPQDYKRAFLLYMKLANAGEARCQFMVGDMYARGLGVAPDMEAAFRWFKSAAERGNVNALRNVALLRIHKGEWIGLLSLGKALALTLILRLFDKHSDRLERL